MKELTNEIRAKVFAMYLGCSVKWETNKGVFDGTLVGIATNEYPQLKIHSGEEGDAGTHWTTDESVKLILKSLSAISDEDAIEVINLIEPSTVNHCPNIKSLINYLRGRIDQDCRKDYRVYSLLIERGYSVPLFCLDGQDPLTANLAITPEQVNKSMQA